MFKWFWSIFSLGAPASKLTSPNYWIHGRNIWHWDCVNKGTRFKEKSILDAKTHFKQMETFLHTHFTSCHPLNGKKGFVKGEALRILPKNSSEITFEENNSNFKKNAWWRRLPTLFDRKPTIRNKKYKRESKLLKQNNKEEKEILPFVTQYQPSVFTIKEA